MTNLKTFRYPIVLLVLTGLIVADGYITDFIISSGLAREGNPLMKASLVNGSFMWFKVLGGIFCAVILWDIYKRHPRLAMLTSMAGIIFYTGIVYWNIACVFMILKFM